jgi:acetyl-CoA synthetase
VPDEITGLAINAIVSLKTSETPEKIAKDLVLKIRQTIGPFAAPKRVVVVTDLPKTRSGKIVRRILRKALTGETDFGDTSTVSIIRSLLFQIMCCVR